MNDKRDMNPVNLELTELCLKMESAEITWSDARMELMAILKNYDMWDRTRWDQERFPTCPKCGELLALDWHGSCT